MLLNSLIYYFTFQIITDLGLENFCLSVKCSIQALTHHDSTYARKRECGFLFRNMVY